MSAGNTASQVNHHSTSSESAYTAYNAVDDLVAKPVLGSDGTAKWQNFTQHVQSKLSKSNSNSVSVAPTAPLKALDRAVGFVSWKEEREYSNKTRYNDDNENGTKSAGVYTHFSKSHNTSDHEITAKERKRIERRIIGSDQEYFTPSTTFMGWKFDYVFTTKSSHGTGYYFDGMDSIKKLNGQLLEEDVPLPKISHSDAASKKRCINNDNADKTILTQDQIVKVKKTKKAKKSPTVTIVNDPNHPMEQVAAILAQRASSVRNQNSTMLPNGWDVARASDGMEYYYNRTTGERTWDKPTSTKIPESDLSGNKGTKPEKLQHPTNNWNVATDPSTGKVYYYNTLSGETLWEKPS
jgi:WW domain